MAKNAEGIMRGWIWCGMDFLNGVRNGGVLAEELTPHAVEITSKTSAAAYAALPAAVAPTCFALTGISYVYTGVKMLHESEQKQGFAYEAVENARQALANYNPGQGESSVSMLQDVREAFRTHRFKSDVSSDNDENAALLSYRQTSVTDFALTGSYSREASNESNKSEQSLSNDCRSGVQQNDTIRKNKLETIYQSAIARKNVADADVISKRLYLSIGISQLITAFYTFALDEKTADFFNYSVVATGHAVYWLGQAILFGSGLLFLGRGAWMLGSACYSYHLANKFHKDFSDLVHKNIKTIQELSNKRGTLTLTEKQQLKNAKDALIDLLERHSAFTKKAQEWTFTRGFIGEDPEDLYDIYAGKSAEEIRNLNPTELSQYLRDMDKGIQKEKADLFLHGVIGFAMILGGIALIVATGLSAGGSTAGVAAAAPLINQIASAFFLAMEIIFLCNDSEIGQRLFLDNIWYKEPDWAKDIPPTPKPIEGPQKPFSFTETFLKIWSASPRSPQYNNETEIHNELSIDRSNNGSGNPPLGRTSSNSSWSSGTSTSQRQ